MSEFHHVSVLLEECIEGLAIKPDGIYVDGTLGGAGHSSRIAAKLTTGRLIGIDRDNVALEAAAERLKPYEDRVTLVHANFCDMDEALGKLGHRQGGRHPAGLGRFLPPAGRRVSGAFPIWRTRRWICAWNGEDVRRRPSDREHMVLRGTQAAFCMITARSALRPGSPRPSAAAGSRRPSRRRWSWWT